MRQRLFIFIFAIAILAVLVGLNAATYTQKEKTPDSEAAPNRSTFNAGATGTQGFYALLAETGRQPMRWQQPVSELISASNKPAVFVVVGSVRRPFTEEESEELLRWVAGGGRLVLIDRAPPESLTTTTANWQIAIDEAESSDAYPPDPSDRAQMTETATVGRPVQPTSFARSVIAIQPSRYAASIRFTRFSGGETYDGGGGTSAISGVPSPSQSAPVAHIAAGDRNLVVDAPFGNGRIILLSDPYITSNAGISLLDNAQLALNLVETADGTVAFDEYHQGFGSSNNRFLEFFEGTPVVAIFLQSALIAVLALFSQSRRFARPVPQPEPDRLSKLEYIDAMGELQRRTKAFDLALENIYDDFRRRATRALGLDNKTVKSGEIAARAAERSGITREPLAAALFKCEEIIRGEPTHRREVVELVQVLRDVERKLGLVRSAGTRF